MMKVIRFKEFLKEQLLLEAYDYSQMFTKYISLKPEAQQEWFTSEINTKITNVITRLKKNIRII
jgi:hypothetical protein